MAICWPCFSLLRRFGSAELPGGGKRIWKYILAAVLLCLSCGIYQSYISFAMVMTLCLMLLYLFEEEHSTKKIFLWGLKQLVVYAAALVAYWVIWQVIMKVKHIHPNDYQGIDDLKFSLDTILYAFPRCIEFCKYMFLERRSVIGAVRLYSWLNILFIGLLALGLVAVVVKKKIYRKIDRLLLTVLALVAIPFASTMWCFTSPEVSYRPMMLLALVFVYILGAVLFDRYLKLKNLVGLLLALVIFNNGLSANIAYYYMQWSYETSFATGAEMVSRIHQLDPPSNKLVVVGSVGYDVRLPRADRISNHISPYTRFMVTDLNFDAAHIVRFLNHTFRCSYMLVGGDELTAVVQSEAVQTMGCWPATDSVAIVNDVIVIKLAEP